MSQIHEISVALVGFPNVGKSTLLNAVVGVPLSAVSGAPGTTRLRVVGVTQRRTPKNHTVIQWLDAPGFFQENRRGDALERRLYEEAQQAISDSSILCLLEDGSRSESHVCDRLAQAMKLLPRKPDVIVLTKADLVRPRGKLLSLLNQISQKFPDTELVPLSARREEGVDIFVNLVEDMGRKRRQTTEATPEVEEAWDGVFTLNTQRQLAADWIRGAVLEGLRAEVPLSTDVLVDEFSETEKDIVVRASIWVERDGQKGIILGSGAERLKNAGTFAREKLAAIFDKPTHVFLHVKVKEQWSERTEVMHELGY